MEKVIQEFRIVETDDGFRIEIKGDKEAIRRMIGLFDFRSFFGGRGPFAQGPRPGGAGWWGGAGSWWGGPGTREDEGKHEA